MEPTGEETGICDKIATFPSSEPWHLALLRIPSMEINGRSKRDTLNRAGQGKTTAVSTSLPTLRSKKLRHTELTRERRRGSLGGDRRLGEKRVMDSVGRRAGKRRGFNTPTKVTENDEKVF